MSRQTGFDNTVFTIENDPDRIEVVGTCSSYSDLNSTGSQNLLTGFTNSVNSIEAWSDGADLVQREDSILSANGVPATLRVSTATPATMVRRWSQNISKPFRGGKTIREKTINRLPSRKIFEAEGRLLSATNSDEEIEQLANEIEQHGYLMQDTALGKQIRIDTIRALPHPLSIKRRLKEKLSISVTQQMSEDKTTLLKNLYNYACHLGLKIWSFLHLCFNGIEIWYDSMKTIEGHFGSSVGTYFKFLRWLFILNVILFVFTFCFLTFPQILYDSSYKNETTNATLYRVSDWKMLDLLTGEGYMRTSILFYGAYINKTFSLGSSTHSYSLPHAYYMTMLLQYLCTFVVISISMARSYRKSFIETSGELRSMYAHKIFCSWDFGILNSKAAQLKHSMVFTELKEVLNEMHESKKDISALLRVWMFCSQFIAHVLVGAIIAGLGMAIWILLKMFGEENKNTPWTKLYVATVVNLSMLLLQAFFSWIAKMEDYRSPRRALHITLVRNFVLEAVVIGVLICFWLNKNYKECWETSIGQEIYRLIISDFFINVIVLPLVYAFRLFVANYFWPKASKAEFDISQKSLGLVFNQTLLWAGLLFSPLLAGVMVIKMMLMFYIKKTALIYLCKSPTHMWRSAQTQTLYLVFTFLSLFGVLIAFGYIMTQVPVSPKCGPFRDYDFMFQIFIDGVLKLRQHDWIWGALMTIVRPAVVGGILLSMIVVVYYLRSKSKARGLMVKLLKEMLYLEAKDKEFILMHIAKITKDRDWLFDDSERADRDNTAATPSAAKVNKFSESSLKYRCSINNTQGSAQEVDYDGVANDHILRSRRT